MSDLDSLFNEDWPEDHRSGVVAVVGRPNVGKSTFINAVLKQKIAIVTPKPQTTRKRQLGIYTEEHGQILFIDTPGIHQPHHKLGEYMVDAAMSALQETDVILWLVDVTQPPHPEDRQIAAALKRAGDAKIVIVFNKCDLTYDPAQIEAYRALVLHHTSVTISALNAEGIAALVQLVMTLLPLGPRYYPPEQVSEVNMRFITAEVIREKIILNTEQEIPYSVAISIESFREGEDRTEISAIIYVERDSQKGILIGKGGQMIKKIGTEARMELVGLLETAVHLDLRVKVLKNWRSDEDLMRRMGYRIRRDDD